MSLSVKPELPARRLYEDVLPSVVRALTHSAIPYHPGSPYGGPEWYDTTDPTRGDVHQWGVWAGTKLHHDYDILGGRFVSEFGIPALPDLRTVAKWLETDGLDVLGQIRSEKRGEKIVDRANAQHCRAGSYQRRLQWNMAENFGDTGTYGRCATHFIPLRVAALIVFSAMRCRTKACVQYAVPPVRSAGFCVSLLEAPVEGTWKRICTFVVSLSYRWFLANSEFCVDSRGACLATKRLLACLLMVNC